MLNINAIVMDFRGGLFSHKKCVGLEIQPIYYSWTVGRITCGKVIWCRSTRSSSIIQHLSFAPAQALKTKAAAAQKRGSNSKSLVILFVVNEVLRV